MLMGLSSIWDPRGRTSGIVCSSVIQATGVSLWLLPVAFNTLSAIDKCCQEVGFNLAGAVPWEGCLHTTVNGTVGC